MVRVVFSNRKFGTYYSPIRKMFEKQYHSIGIAVPLFFIQSVLNSYFIDLFKFDATKLYCTRSHVLAQIRSGAEYLLSARQVVISFF